MGLFDQIGKGLSSLFGGASEMLSGTPAQYDQISGLTPEQMRGQKLLERAGRKRGAGGAFGQSADFYRDILENDPQALQELYAPELRQFNQQTIPDLAEQFAGMGSGALSSSGFRNAAVGAGTDLSERLASMRQQLRFNAAQGLSSIGAQGLQPHSSYQQTNPGTEGFLSNIAPAVGTAVGTYFGGPIGGALGNAAGNLFGGSKSMSPYGGQNPSSPQTGSFTSQPSGYKGSFGSLPDFQGRY